MVHIVYQTAAAYTGKAQLPVYILILDQIRLRLFNGLAHSFCKSPCLELDLHENIQNYPKYWYDQYWYDPGHFKTGIHRTV